MAAAGPFFLTAMWRRVRIALMDEGGDCGEEDVVEGPSVDCSVTYAPQARLYKAVPNPIPPVMDACMQCV